MPFEDQIFQAIKLAMPTNAEVKAVPGKPLNFTVSWKLDDDPVNRPNKRSKALSICVSDEASEALESKSANEHAAVYKRVTGFLTEKLAQFDPTHDVKPPPDEQWVITEQVILG